MRKLVYIVVIIFEGSIVIFLFAYLKEKEECYKKLVSQLFFSK